MANNTHTPSSSAGAVQGRSRFIWRPLNRTNTPRSSAAAGLRGRSNCQINTQPMLATNNRLATDRRA